jgi:hypothetical protein
MACDGRDVFVKEVCRLWVGDSSFYGRHEIKVNQSKAGSKPLIIRPSKQGDLSLPFSKQLRSYRELFSRENERRSKSGGRS